jgi:hypothetical protein
LSGYFDASPAERGKYLLDHPKVRIDLEAYNGIKDTVYPAMDQAAGKPPGFFAELKGRQQKLIDLQEHLDKQADELATASGVSRGSPRFSHKNLSTYLAGTHDMHPGLSLHRLNPIKADPLAAANKAVRRAMSGAPKAQKYVYSYPVREAIVQAEGQQETPPERNPIKLAKGYLHAAPTARPKPPGQQIRDLRKIQEKYSDNPAMPIGPGQ